MKKVNVLVCSTGSVAAIKLPMILNLFKSSEEVEVKLKVCLTEKAKYFCKDLTGFEVYSDDDEWSAWKGRGDPVLHIDIGKWADVLVLAPLDANTLGKIASGICDNFLTCIIRAWETSKPLFFCPAMNTKMYTHPITSLQISTLKSWGYHEIPCIAKTLICGDTGLGAMEEPEVIVNLVINFVKSL